MNSYNDYMNSYVYEFIYMNSYDFFIYEFICFMNSYMNSGVPRFQMARRLVLVHWESCLQGSVHPAAEPSRADSDIRVRTTITQ